MKVKLGEIGTFKNGLNYSADNIMSGCKMIGIPDFGYNYIAKIDDLREIDANIVSDEYLLDNNDILFVRSNGNKNLVGRSMIVQGISDKVTFSGFCIRFRIHSKNVNPLYMLYLFKSPMFRKLFSNTQQTSITNLNQEVLGNIQFDIPTLERQHKIVQAIHSITKKIECNNLINDNLQQQMTLMYEYMISSALSSNIEGCFTTTNKLTEVITGKEDANFSSNNGKYKFFTCANAPLLCDSAAFESSSVLIAGNGDFNVKHYSGKFNAYQRTYVLTPKTEYYGLLYLSCLYRINSFKSSSAGSIVKFITKGDIESIPVYIPKDTSYLKFFNNLVFAQEQLLIENDELMQLRDWLLPMLMNGQASIDD